MPSIFTRPIQQLELQDIQELCELGYSEDEHIDYKAGNPNNPNDHYPWTNGDCKKISDEASNKILEEVIAFANAHGGTVVIGIQESDGDMPRADKIKPILQCEEFSNRFFSQIRDCIDPKLPMIQVQPIKSDSNGHGVIVIRVPQSRLAPHRLSRTKECHYRRGSQSATMSMTEIKDLCINVERGLDKIDKMFNSRNALFESWVKNNHIGIRVTGIPISGEIYIDDLFEHPKLYNLSHPLPGHIHDKFFDFGISTYSTTIKPIIRGIQKTSLDAECPMKYEMHCAGLVELCYQNAIVNPRNNTLILFSKYLLDVVLTTILDAYRFRLCAGYPDIEYGLEVEIHTNNLHKIDVSAITGINRMVECQVDSPKMFLLPRYSFKGVDSINPLLNIIYNDLLDFAGIVRERDYEAVNIDVSKMEL